MAAHPGQSRIRVGIGGWNYTPWRQTFYPNGTPQNRELEYASRHVTSIEINSTFYRLQKPAVFAKWHDSTPDEFIFSIKAPRFIVQRTDLAGAGAAVDRFISSGITRLQSKLGPILWQLPPTKQFDPSDLNQFLTFLPRSAGRLALRHALEIRHPSFMKQEFLRIAREHKVAVVFDDDDTYPGCADVTSNFVYARLRRSAASIKTGYTLRALNQWVHRAETWAKGGEPADLPRIAPKARTAAAPRDVFIYFINGAKERAPAAAQQLLLALNRKNVTSGPQSS
jgi:uncharacterized protein YecE (DUF72 family)